MVKRVVGEVERSALEADAGARRKGAATIQWQFFPKSDAPTPLSKQVVAAFFRPA